MCNCKNSQDWAWPSSFNDRTGRKHVRETIQTPTATLKHWKELWQLFYFTNYIWESPQYSDKTFWTFGFHCIWFKYSTISKNTILSMKHGGGSSIMLWDWFSSAGTANGFSWDKWYNVQLQISSWIGIFDSFDHVGHLSQGKLPI